MKKLTGILSVAFLAINLAWAQAAVLSDAQLAGITAGFDTSINDDVTAAVSAVASQKNIAVVGSTDGEASLAIMENMNTADLDNSGDSAVALQANIGAVSGLGTQVVSADNVMANSNEATVNNGVISDAGSADLALDGQAGSSSSGIDSMLSTVSALQSAVAVQNNIGAVVGGAGVANSSIANSNIADVSNTI